MRESRRGLCFYKSRIYAGLMLCMAVCMTGCNPEEILGLTGEEIFAEISETAIEKTLTLEEIESRDDASRESEVISEVQLLENGSFLYEGGCTYGKDGLSAAEQIWYHDMEQALGCMAENVKLSPEGLEAGLDESKIDKIFQCVMADHPELFYVEGYSYTRYTQGEKVVAIEFGGTYSMDVETAISRKVEIEQAVDELLVSAGNLEDDYEKIKFAYETLIENTDYDMNAKDNQNIYSVFVNRASVCQGYAKAFQYLMSKMDVECALVQGTVLETGEGHAWNLVKSSGDYYYVDPTWGDISYQSTVQQADENNLPGISYDYLCVTSQQLFLTHEVEDYQNLPECVALSDNYYVREDALFTEYDEEQLTRLIDRKLADGKSDIAVRCSSEACYQEMCEALIDRQEMFTYLAGSGIQSFAYSRNDSQLTLTFFMMTSQG